MRVMTIVGTRPELIKLSEIIKKLDKHTDHIFVHTGQNYDYELNEIFYEDLDLRQPDYYLGANGLSLGVALSNIFKKVEDILLTEKPDVVVILGDTNSALAGIIVKRMKTPLFHLEAGNRCFDDNVPEEINRRILDHIADVNLVYTENERRYLMDEGVAKDRTFIMGSPMKEVLLKQHIKISESKILQELELTKQGYFLASLHREENIDDKRNLATLLNTLSLITHKYALPVIVSAHPRLRKKIKESSVNSGVKFMKPFGFIDYNHLQMNAKCVISDSGTIAEESAILGFPAITVRNAIERPEAIDAGSILMTGVDEDSILKCLEVAKPPTTIPQDYATHDCSDRVLKIILGYTDYVNRVVWRKS